MKFLAMLVCATFVFGGKLVAAEKVVETNSDWRGFARRDFIVAGRPCLVVMPKKAAAGNPWLWRMEFFGHAPDTDLALLELGWHVAYMNVSDMYGAPKAIALLAQFHAEITSRFKLAPKAALVGLSRGGLYAVNYAVTYPEHVNALYLDAPVLNLASWPGVKHPLWAECLESYGLAESEIFAAKVSPLDHVEKIAAAKIPIISVCGDVDKVVPMADNTSLFEKRYRELGGTIEVLVKPGVGHHPHGLSDPQPIVDFLVKHVGR
ncbi:alpha/beta hydrolase family protein [Oleiharenicola lentus]|uniref:alpha/beta hydrolase family protein n=1 Tax=Oleiharenicola lentus TaxID=2508720 RepID=UPI003F6762AB